MAYLLGLDLGTSSLKGLVFDHSGNLINTASADYPLSSPDLDSVSKILIIGVKRLMQLLKR